MLFNSRFWCPFFTSDLSQTRRKQDFGETRWLLLATSYIHLDWFWIKVMTHLKEAVSSKLCYGIHKPQKILTLHSPQANLCKLCRSNRGERYAKRNWWRRQEHLECQCKCCWENSTLVFLWVGAQVLKSADTRRTSSQSQQSAKSHFHSSKQEESKDCPGGKALLYDHSPQILTSSW